jgi:hypothetical protein
MRNVPPGRPRFPGMGAPGMGARSLVGIGATFAVAAGVALMIAACATVTSAPPPDGKSYMFGFSGVITPENPNI